ncbi:MAG: DNA-3-methyladenine glycosylase I [Acidimicrobiales bacterium]
MSGPVDPGDGRPRCPWAMAAPELRSYHDDEWGRPVTGDTAVFERIVLEGFQSGLSWLTILRKREGFRRAFAGFDIATVAAYGTSDVERLLADAGIVRHRGKIEAAVGNARAALALAGASGSLAELVWRFAPPPGRAIPTSMDDLPSQTPESVALSRALRGLGFRFVGPTTVYAAMQALGVVDDHLAGCSARTAGGS